MAGRRFEICFNPVIDDTAVRDQVLELVGGFDILGRCRRINKKTHIDGKDRIVTAGIKGVAEDEAGLVSAFPKIRSKIIEILGHEGVQLNFEILK